MVDKNANVCYYNSIMTKNSFPLQRQENQDLQRATEERAKRHNRIAGTIATIAGAGAISYLALTGGGESNPQKPAADPTAPKEDVVTTPDGYTREIADDKYQVDEHGNVDNAPDVPLVQTRIDELDSDPNTPGNQTTYKGGGDPLDPNLSK